MRSSDQLARLLTLVPYLQSHPGLTVADLAEHYGTTSKRIQAELTLLWMCGPSSMPGDQIEFNMDDIEAGGAIEVSNADYLTRPMRFSQEEAFALVVALHAIAEVVTSEQAQAVASALAKLEALIGQRGAPRVAVRVAGGDQGVRAIILDAIESGTRLRLTYDGVSRGRTTEPVVDPVEIAVRDGAAYLRAWSLDRGDWRTYRLERVVQAEPTGDPVSDHGELPALTQTWFDGRATVVPVVLDLASSSRWLAEYDPVDSVSELPGGGVRATFPLVDPAWLTHRLLQLGDQVRLVSPIEAGDEAVRAARAGLELYLDLDPDTASGTSS